MKQLVIKFILLLAIAAILGGVGILSLMNGYLRFNYPSISEYPVQGIDVSNHQKNIDWAKLTESDNRVQFAFIKATEGGDFKDKRFEQNWAKAKEHNVIVGAYHFFTFCRSPEDQAKNFIETVPNDPDMLPPAIDLEYSGNCKLTKTKEELLNDIECFIQIIEEYYQCKMIIYVAGSFYSDVMLEKFDDNPFWVRDVFKKPHPDDNRVWTFWQFSSKGRFEGVETLLDMNVYSGSEVDFQNFIKSKGHQKSSNS